MGQPSDGLTTRTLSPRDTSANGACKVGATVVRVSREVGVVSPRHAEKVEPAPPDTVSDSQAHLRFGDLHAFARVGADQIRFGLFNHWQYIEQQWPTRVTGVVDESSDPELHILYGEFVDDVLEISKVGCQAVELGHY